MQKLFSEFKPSSAQEWKQQIIKDLKGESFESLIWHNENGIEITPFFTSEDLKKQYAPAFTHASWEVTAKGYGKTSEELNRSLLDALNQGASSVSVHLQNLDPAIILKGIELEHIASVFYVNEKNAKALFNYLDKNYNNVKLNCTVLPESLITKAELEKWHETTLQNCKNKHIRTTGVDLTHIHNLNCFAYYEVAVIISALVEHLEYFSKKNTKPLNDFVVKTGVSSDYFVQMAKLRALRRIWKLLQAEYRIENNLYLVVETSLTNKSISDSYNNLLRTTIEAMAAVSGGCNELIICGFDTLFANENKFSSRLAINQQSILKEESYFDKMADVSCGSYYIEHLTDAIAHKALDQFKSFENQGGYFACTTNNVITKACKEQGAQKEEAIKNQKQLAIGVNKFRNEKENINIAPEKLEALKHASFSNPVLNFELEHFFKLKNA